MALLFDDGKVLSSGVEDEFESCVVCGKNTGVKRNVPIQQRATYVSGAGQLCESCCLELYHTNDLRMMDEP